MPILRHTFSAALVSCRAFALAALLVSAWAEVRAQQTSAEILEDARTAYANDELDRAVGLYKTVSAALGTQEAERVEALETLAVIARTQGRFEDAIDWAERTREAAREGGYPLAEGEALQTRGLAAYSLGRHDEAVANVRASLEIHRGAGHGLQEVIRLTNLGGLAQLAGHYFEAQEQYETALARIGDYGAEPWAAERRAVAVANLASLYQRLGRYEKALDLYKASQSGSDLAFGNRAQLLANMGVLYRRLGDPYKAVEIYSEAEALAAGIGDVVRVMSVGINRGIALALDLGRLEEAERAFEGIREIAAASGAKRERLHATLYLAETQRRRGQLDAAAQMFGAALKQAGALGLAEEKWKALFGLGRIAEEQANLPKAEALYRQAIEGVVSLRSRLESENLKRGFLADRVEPYTALIGILLRSHGAGPSCGEGGICEELVRLIGAQRAASGSGTTDNSELKSMREDLASAWKQRLEAEPAQRAELDVRIERLEHEYERAEARGPAESRPSLPELQGGLDSKAAILVLWAGRNTLLRMWIGGDSVRYEVVPFGSAERGAVRSYSEAAADPGREWRKPAREAGRILLGDSARDAGALLVYEDASLGSMPIESLIPVDAPEPLIEYMSVAYLEDLRAPEAGEAAWSWPWSRTLAAFAYGQPEPGSGLAALESASAEASQAAALVPGKGAAFLEVEATRARLTEELTHRPAILHFATHAVLDEEHPELSRLLLSPGEAGRTRPEPLLLAEVERLPLTGVRLAVLSACDTARGQQGTGGGVRSLGRAFLNAGAESVVAGLWRVPDAETAALMDQFYYWIGKGEERAEALRHAKISLSSGEHPLHPYYWAGFRLTTRVVGPAVRPIPWAPPLIGAGLALGLLVAVRRRTK